MNAPVQARQRVHRVDLTDPAECVRIEDFVRSREGSLFQRPAWLVAVERGTGQKACGYVVEQMGVITGWLPLTEVRSRLLARRSFPAALAWVAGCSQMIPMRH